MLGEEDKVEIMRQEEIQSIEGNGYIRVSFIMGRMWINGEGTYFLIFRF